MVDVGTLSGQGGLLAEGAVRSGHQLNHRTVDATVMMERRFDRHEIAEAVGTASALQVLQAGNQAADHLEGEAKEASSDILAPVANPPGGTAAIFWDPRMLLTEVTGSLIKVWNVQPSGM